MMEYTKQTIEFTKQSLPKGAVTMMTMVMNGAVRMFENHGEVSAAKFYVGDGDGDVGCEELTINDQTRPAVWAGLREWRSRYPFVGFVSEIWGKQYKPGEWKPGDKLPRPSECPDKFELVMFVLFVGERTITFSADIKRNPSRLGPWKVTWDTAFPTKEGPGELGGAMMDRPDVIYPVKGN